MRLRRSRDDFDYGDWVFDEHLRPFLEALGDAVGYRFADDDWTAVDQHVLNGGNSGGLPAGGLASSWEHEPSLVTEGGENLARLDFPQSRQAYCSIRRWASSVPSDYGSRYPRLLPDAEQRVRDCAP